MNTPTREDIVRWANTPNIARVEVEPGTVIETNEDGWKYQLKRTHKTTLQMVGCEPPPEPPKPVKKIIKLTGKSVVVAIEVCETADESLEQGKGVEP